jgi:hypothetical protein
MSAFPSPPANGAATIANQNGWPRNSASQERHNAPSPGSVFSTRASQVASTCAVGNELELRAIAGKSSMGTTCTSKKLRIAPLHLEAAAGERGGDGKTRRLLLSKLRFVVLLVYFPAAAFTRRGLIFLEHSSASHLPPASEEDNTTH